MMYLLLLVGFVLLLKGADFFVDGSSSIAGILRVPSIVIGLTIVAMGTSAPETAVSITAGLAGNSDLSLGNIVGSNIFNLLMVIGISALLRPIATHKDMLRRDLWWNIAVSAVLFLFLLDGRLSRLEGVLLLVGMAAYLFVVIRSAIRDRSDAEPIRQLTVTRSLLYIIGGLIAIIFGGNLVVNNASLIARSLGMSDTLVGLTIVAIGTSLPELMTSIVAARKGDSGIALGNAVGSCIFNIMFILGAASVLTPIHVAPELLIDTAILIVVCILILVLAKTQHETSRAEGLICIFCYVAYTIYIIAR